MDGLKTPFTFDFCGQTLTAHIWAPKDKAHGDYTTDIAFVISRALSEMAQAIEERYQYGRTH